MCKSRPNFHPSCQEFAGWYNIREDRGDGLPVLRSTDQLPEFEHGEFLDLYLTEAQWFHQLVPIDLDLPFDPLAELPLYVRSDADDRTLVVDVDFTRLTLPLIERIQTEFLARHPLWRIALVGEDSSNTIMVYPGAIRFGSLPTEMNAPHALSELASRVSSLREARLRQRRAQFDRLRQRLPEAVHEIGDCSFLIFNVIDNHEGDYSRLTIGMLIRGMDTDAWDIEGPKDAGDEFLGSGPHFGIDSVGTITGYIEDCSTAAHCMMLWTIPADYRGPLSIVQRTTGKRHPYELTSGTIIRTAVDM